MEPSELVVRLEERTSELARRVGVIDAMLLEGKFTSRDDHLKLAEDVKSLRESRSSGQGERGIIERVLNNPLVAAAIGALLMWLLTTHR